MPEMLRFSRRVEDRIYELALTWDTESFVDGTPRIAVSASVAPASNPEDAQSLFAAITLEGADMGPPDIVVRIQDREILRVPLEGVVDESIIDHIPAALFGAGDPIVGCLVRAGLSAVVAQILQCRHQTREVPWYRPRIRAMATHLRRTAGSMAVGMVTRAVRCIVL